MTRVYTVGLPRSLFRSDGSANFPSYDLSALADEAAVDVSYFEGASPVVATSVAGFDSIVLLGERMGALDLSPIVLLLGLYFLRTFITQDLARWLMS